MQEEGWVVCRVFKKRLAATMRRMEDYESSPSNWYDDHLSFMASELHSNPPSRTLHNHHHHQQPFPYGLNASSAYTHNNNPNLQCKKELELHYNHMVQHQQQNHHLHESIFHQIPQLETPNSNCNSLPYGSSNNGNNTRNIGKLQQSSTLTHQEQFQQGSQSFRSVYYDQDDQVNTDWRVLDKFVASQLSNEEVAAPASASTHQNNNKMDARNTDYQMHQGMNLLENDSERVFDMGEEHANAHAGFSSSSYQIDLWK